MGVSNWTRELSKDSRKHRIRTTTGWPFFVDHNTKETTWQDPRKSQHNSQQYGMPSRVREIPVIREGGGGGGFQQPHQGSPAREIPIRQTDQPIRQHYQPQHQQPSYQQQQQTSYQQQQQGYFQQQQPSYPQQPPTSAYSSSPSQGRQIPIQRENQAPPQNWQYQGNHGNQPHGNQPHSNSPRESHQYSQSPKSREFTVRGQGLGGGHEGSQSPKTVTS